MKILKFLSMMPVITLLIIFQAFLQDRNLIASEIRNGEIIFRNVCAGCHVRGGSVVLKGSKSLKHSDIEKRGISDENSIAKIPSEGIGFMKGYKHELKKERIRFLHNGLFKMQKKVGSR